MASTNGIKNAKSEALVLAWRKRKDYVGYDKSRGSKFNSWRSFVYNKKNAKIGYPEQWKNYKVFDEETNEGWEKGKILCRIDTSKPYSKENCEWREKGEENLGKLAKLEYNGETKTLLEWCTEFNLNYNGVRQRYFRGKNYTPYQILFGKKGKLAREIKDINTISETQEQRNKVSKMLSSYRLRDKKRGLECDIDFEWLLDKIKNGKCCYCEDTNNLGLDRVDNAKGHTKDNVVVCCYSCNVARSNNFTYNEMLELGKTIKEIKRKRNENK